MKSDFEKRAAQEAVDAVERRYERNRKAERQLDGRRRLGRVVIIAVALAGGIWVWRNFFGGDLSSLPALPSLSSLTGPSDSLSETRRQFGDTLRLLLTGEVQLSSEMPEDLRIKNRRPGLRYAILTPPADGWFSLYELVRGPTGELAVSELSPVRSPRRVTAADLRAALSGKPCLVAVRGGVYLFGSRELQDAERLRSRVRALAGAR